MLFIILGDIKVMGVEGLFRLQQSNYTQRREYHSIQNQLVEEISCGSKLHLFQLKNQHLSLAEQPNSFKYSSYPLKVRGLCWVSVLRYFSISRRKLVEFIYFFSFSVAASSTTGTELLHLNRSRRGLCWICSVVEIFKL